MDEITRIRTFRADVTPPSGYVVGASRRELLAVIDSRPTGRWWAIRSRRALAAAIALVCLLGTAGAIAASGLLGNGILSGNSAPPENAAALRALFPPYSIGRATELAHYDGRKLFGARTRRGGYCFSATSPTDPTGEGGHCVSNAEARTLDAGRTVAFAMSGASVGGYAPGASKVRVSGAGIRVTVPVGENGWWLGVARLSRDTLPDGEHRAFVVATSIGPDGRVLGHDALMFVTVYGTGAGRVIQVAFN
jgi:hypothetical protein